MKRRSLNLFVFFAFGTCSNARHPLCNDPYDCIELGEKFGDEGDHRGAERAFKAALAYDSLPREHKSQVLYNLGYTLLQAGHLADALGSFESSLKLSPSFMPALLKAGFCAKQIGQLGVAAGYLKRALDASGGRDPQTWSHYGDVLNNLKRFREAADAYSTGLKALTAAARAARGGPSPGQVRSMAADLHASLADTQLNSGNTSSAVASLRKALGHVPTHAAALASLSLATAELADWRSREEHILRLLQRTRAALSSREPSPLSPYGTLFLEEVDHSLRVDVAASWADRVQRTAPEATLDGGGDSAARAYSAQFLAALGRQRRLDRVAPLRLGYLSRRFHDYPGTHLMAGLFSRHGGGRVNNASDGTALRVQPVSVSCFASGPDDAEGAARRRVARDCDGFADISLQAVDEAAAALARRGVDVLLSYDGAHDLNDFTTLARRPARYAQAAFLGFAGTSGMRRGPRSRSDQSQPPAPLDATVVDRVIAPVESAHAMFSESLWYMPRTYQPQDPDQPLGAPRLVREMAGGDAGWREATRELRAREGLPLRAPPPLIGASASADSPADDPRVSASGERALRITVEDASLIAPAASSSAKYAVGAAAPPFVFASFNRWSKHEPRMWDTWMGALGRAPGSVLWLYGGGSEPRVFVSVANSSLSPAPGHVANLWAEAAARGVHPSRLIFAPRRTRPAHLHRHYAADVMLDSLVYGAHTTAADGLYTGLPLLTLAGEGMAARVGASLLGAATTGSHNGDPSMSGEGGPSDAIAHTFGVSHSLREYADVASASALRGSAWLRRTVRTRLQAGVVATCARQGATCGASGAANEATREDRLDGSQARDAANNSVYDAASFAASMERLARAAGEARALSTGRGAWHVVAP